MHCPLNAVTQAVLPLIALLSTGAVAAPVPPSKIFGDWEVIRLLVPKGFSNSQRSMNPDDGRVVGRKYSFQANAVIIGNEAESCKLDTSLARQTLPIKALFAEERLPRPKLIRDRFYRRAAHYALGTLARESVTIYRYRCEKKNDDLEIMVNSTGNWFAASKGTIIWPLAPDALVVMKRQPTQPTAEQAAYCGTATLASDKTICGDREMWLMKVYTETARDCAIAYDLRSPNEMRKELDAYVNKRNACEGVRTCVYEVLSEHASILGQRVPSVSDCLDLKQKK